MILFILLHFQLLIIKLPSLMFLPLNVLLLIIIPLSHVCEVSQLQLLLLLQFLSIWTVHLRLISILLHSLIFFNSCLLLLLYFVVLPDTTKAFVVVCHSIDASLFVSDGIFQFDWLLEFLVHHASLPMLSFSLCF